MSMQAAQTCNRRLNEMAHKVTTPLRSAETGNLLRMTVGDGVAIITRSRPPVNAIGEERLRRFDRVPDYLAGRSDRRMLHVRSLGLPEARLPLVPGAGGTQRYAASLWPSG
jgi:enoyl-CoA hydratase/carnithine racemase